MTSILLQMFISPPDLVGIGLMFYPGYIFHLSFFVGYALRAHWTELNQNLLHVRKWPRFGMHAQNFDYSIPL